MYVNKHPRNASCAVEGRLILHIAWGILVRTCNERMLMLSSFTPLIVPSSIRNFGQSLQRAMPPALNGRTLWMIRFLCHLLFSIAFCTAFKSTAGLQRKQHCNRGHRDRQSELFALVPIKLITDNRKSGFEYEFTERYEAGVMLTGTEVKSCRKGMVQLSDSMAEIINGECWLLNCHIGISRYCFHRTDS